MRKLEEIYESLVTEGMVTIDTIGYRTNNAGKEPKGKGNWYFFVDKERNDFNRAFTFNGNYGDAVKAAKKWAQTELGNRGLSILYVGG